MKNVITATVLLLFSLLPGACSAALPEVEQYMNEMVGLANDLIAVDAEAEQGNWQEAGQGLERVRVSLAAVDAGIDELEASGVDAKQVAKLRSASTYLHKTSGVSGIMISWREKVAEVNPEGLATGSGTDDAAAVESLNELIKLTVDARSLLWDFLEYGQQYYASDTAGAEKLKAQITVPRYEQLYNDLDARLAEFQDLSWIPCKGDVIPVFSIVIPHASGNPGL